MIHVFKTSSKGVCAEFSAALKKAISGGGGAAAGEDGEFPDVDLGTWELMYIGNTDVTESSGDAIVIAALEVGTALC
jgi:hypothetical protein